MIRGLVKAGAIEGVEVDLNSPYPEPDPDFAPPDAVDRPGLCRRHPARRRSRRGAFEPFLLDGVTGSGKTEVYLEGVAQAIRDGKQALILLPEIALTEPFLKRFTARFGVEPVAWHSGLRSSQRRRAWRAIATRPGQGDGRRAQSRCSCPIPTSA